MPKRIKKIKAEDCASLASEGLVSVDLKPDQLSVEPKIRLTTLLKANGFTRYIPPKRYQSQNRKNLHIRNEGMGTAIIVGEDPRHDRNIFVGCLGGCNEEERLSNEVAYLEIGTAKTVYFDLATIKEHLEKDTLLTLHSTPTVF